MIVIAAITALAQDSLPELKDASLEQLMNAKVYGASKYLQDQRAAPASVTIVTADEIRKHGYRTLAEVLQAAGGFYITYDRSYSYVGVRGFSRLGDYNSRILLLVDGHRLNDSLYDMAMVGTEMPLDVSLIDQVEIIRGPGASLYGTSAFFAVVNVVTRKAPDVRGVEVELEVASFGSIAARLTYGTTYKGADTLLSGTFYGSGGQALYFPEFKHQSGESGVSRHCDGDNSRDLLLNTSYRNWSLEALYGRREKGDPTAAYGTVFNDPLNRTIDTRAFVDAGYRRSFGPWDVWTHGSFDRYDYNGNYAFASTDSGTVVLNRDLNVAEWWGTELNVSRSFKRNHISVGAEYRDNFRQDLRNFDLSPYAQYFDMHLDSRMGAVYVQDEITITPSILLNAGLRHDQYSTFGGATNPRLALILRAAPKTTLKLIYGTAFRTPNVSETYNSDSELNRALTPEQITSSTVIVEQAIRSHIRVTASGYQNRVSDLVSYTDMDPLGRFVFHNEAHATVTGLETGINASSDKGFEGRASYSYVANATSSDPVTLLNSPRHVGTLGFSIPLLKRALYASFDSSYVSRRDTLAGTGVAGRTLFNASLLTRSWKRFDLSASAYNLFDKQYADPGSQWHSQNTIPQNGRSFRVRVAYKFGVVR